MVIKALLFSPASPFPLLASFKLFWSFKCRKILIKDDLNNMIRVFLDWLYEAMETFYFQHWQLLKLLRELKQHIFVSIAGFCGIIPRCVLCFFHMSNKYFMLIDAKYVLFFEHINPIFPHLRHWWINWSEIFIWLSVEKNNSVKSCNEVSLQNPDV